MKNGLRVIIIINFVIAAVLFAVPIPGPAMDNGWCVLLFVLLNVIYLLYSKKIAKNKLICILAICIYFGITWFLPMKKVHSHTHEVINDFERIIDYNATYNCYNVKLSENQYDY